MDTLTRTLIIVGGFNLFVLGLVIVLFRYLDSQATAEGAGPGSPGLGLSKWKAGGALAGFIILAAVQLYIIQYFSPKGVEDYPSYPTIIGFYERIQERDYASAWKLISPNMQIKKYNEDESQFINGYQNTQGVNLLAIDFVSEFSSYSHEYVVYYQDTTDSPVLPGLENLGDLDVRSLPAFNNHVAALRKLLVERGIDTAALDDMKLSELITATRGDILRWKIEKSAGGKTADDLFPTSKTVSRLVGKLVTVGFHDDKWSIDSIDNIPYNKE
jgi:hypothetical protein